MTDQYLRGSLRRKDLDPDPIRQFERWFESARAEHKGNPYAVALATATADGAPSARMVLLKEFGPNGFVFSTNYESRKGLELTENPRAALLFFWEDLEQQIRIEGPVTRATPEASDAIFNDRPVGSRIASITSAQSRPITSRVEMEAAFHINEARIGSEPVRPENWGGYVLKPETMEFWQGGRSRLHDRFRYQLSVNGVWDVERLQP